MGTRAFLPAREAARPLFFCAENGRAAHGSPASDRSCLPCSMRADKKAALHGKTAPHGRRVQFDGASSSPGAGLAAGGAEDVSRGAGLAAGGAEGVSRGAGLATGGAFSSMAHRPRPVRAWRRAARRPYPAAQILRRAARRPYPAAQILRRAARAASSTP